MLKGNWRGHIALGGITAALFLALALIHYHPKSPWLIKNSDLPSAHPANTAQDYQRAANDAFMWLRAVQEQGKANPPADESAQKAKEGENLKDPLDLAAQWVSALSADKMVTLSIWQLAFGLGGFGALIYSLYLTRRSLAETAKQSDMIKKEFHATHRPRLILRQAFSAITDWVEEKITVQYTITNIGDSECWITDSHIGIQFITNVGYPLFHLPPEREFQNIPAHIGRIAPGQTVDCVFTDPTQGWDHEHRKQWIGPRGVFFVGHIAYLDAPGSNIKRQMAFRRKYDIDSQRFVRISNENPDDEYAD